MSKAMRLIEQYLEEGLRSGHPGQTPGYEPAQPPETILDACEKFRCRLERMKDSKGKKRWVIRVPQGRHDVAERLRMWLAKKGYPDTAHDGFRDLVWVY